MSTQPKPKTADPNADQFECDKCHHIRDIEDSIKQPSGELFCDDCPSNAPEAPQDMRLSDAITEANELRESRSKLLALRERDAREYANVEAQRDELLAAAKAVLPDILPSSAAGTVNFGKLHSAIANAEKGAK
jgi:hypothetical protein